MSCFGNHAGRCGFDSWVREIPWRRKWQPTPVFLPGESQGCGSLVGCFLWGRTESSGGAGTLQPALTYLLWAARATQRTKLKGQLHMFLPNSASSDLIQ